MMNQENQWSRTRVATLKDVAETVGVSVSAVSAVLNGAKSGTRVSRRTRQTILEVADRLNYRPNDSARSLASGRTRRIGIYSGVSRISSRNVFYAEVLGGILEGCFKAGMNLVIHATGTTERDLLDLLSSRAIDALVLHVSPDDPIKGILQEANIPAVTLADAVPGIPAVVVDDVAGGRMQAEHLVRLGHKHILYRGSHLPFVSTQTREEAFRKRAQELGAEIVFSEAKNQNPGELTRTELDLLRRQPHTTAIVCWEDLVAHATCATLEDLGWCVGQDVSVVGFNGIMAPIASRFDLTTVVAPWIKVGQVGVEHLTALLEGQSVPSVTTLPVEFHLGKTTCPARFSSSYVPEPGHLATELN